MFQRVDALSYQRTFSSGRTGPMLMRCSAPSGGGSELDVVVKLSGGCDTKEKALVREAFGAFLAEQLGFVVPRPYLVQMSDEFMGSIADRQVLAQLKASNRLAFGSTYIKGAPQPLPISPLPVGMHEAAANVFAFDALFGNLDRRVSRPNCFIHQGSIVLIDHEQAFSVLDTLFAKPWPWIEGSLNPMVDNVPHVFLSDVRGNTLDFSALKNRINGLHVSDVQVFLSAIPTEWGGAALAHGPELVDYYSVIMENIDPAFAEIGRVLQ